MSDVVHAVDIQRQFNERGQWRYRWRCTCGESAKRWCNSRPSGAGSGAAYDRALAGAKTHAKATGGLVT